MLGWFKRKVEEVHQARKDAIDAAAEDAVRFMTNVQAALGGVPRRLLDDPFVVGALAAHAGISIKVISQGQATDAILEAAVIKAVERVFAPKGVSRPDAISALMQFKEHPDYAKGVQVVSLILGARYGHKDFNHDPLVEAARAKIRGYPAKLRNAFGGTEQEQVAYELTRKLFLEPLKEKYGELWRTGDT